MGALFVICFIFSTHMAETFGQLSLLQNRTFDENGLLPSTASGKASNVLREILNQESLVRFSMVQKIQSLVMDAIDSKNDRHVIKTRLEDVIKELQGLETKDLRTDAENAELKQEMGSLSEALNNTKYHSMEEIRNLNETEIWSLKRKLMKKIHVMEKNDFDIKAQIKSLNESEINNLKEQAIALQKENQKMTVESEISNRRMSVLEKNLDILNGSQSTIKNIMFNLQNDKLLRDDLDKLGKTLQQTFDIQVKKVEDMLRIFSISVNKTLDEISVDRTEQNIQWIQCSSYMYKVNVHEEDFHDCWDILQKYPSLQGKDGVYLLNITSKTKFVFCDMTTEGGGWTAIQRRHDGITDFYRTWAEYKEGFGDPSKNYWIGNDAIYELTKNKDQELRVELQDFNGAEAYAKYSTFYVEDEDSKYKLTVSGYSGTAGNSLAYHNGEKFTTKDQDNDIWSNNCATDRHGAWWYKSCVYSNLNGEYAMSAVSAEYMVWFYWKNKYEALKQTVMMIRRKN